MHHRWLIGLVAVAGLPVLIAADCGAEAEFSDDVLLEELSVGVDAAAPVRRVRYVVDVESPDLAQPHRLELRICADLADVPAGRTVILESDFTDETQQNFVLDNIVGGPPDAAPGTCIYEDGLVRNLPLPLTRTLTLRLPDGATSLAVVELQAWASLVWNEQGDRRSTLLTQELVE
jgi:hypothetical protein